jgi:hypothetical protein
VKRLLSTLRKVAEQKRRRSNAPVAVCWLWNKPGITSAEKFATRYRLDPEYRTKQILRSKLKKDHIAQATPQWVDRNQLQDIYARRPDGHHVDHLVPLAGITPGGLRVSGLNVPWNLRYLPGADNLRRSNRMTPEELAVVEAVDRQRFASASQVCKPLESPP